MCASCADGSQPNYPSSVLGNQVYLGIQPELDKAKVAYLGEMALHLGSLQVQVLLQAISSAALLQFLGACLLQCPLRHQPLLLHHAYLQPTTITCSRLSCSHTQMVPIFSQTGTKSVANMTYMLSLSEGHQYAGLWHGMPWHTCDLSKGTACCIYSSWYPLEDTKCCELNIEC